jgi:hypothetical protein
MFERYTLITFSMNDLHYFLFFQHQVTVICPFWATMSTNQRALIKRSSSRSHGVTIHHWCLYCAIIWIRQRFVFKALHNPRSLIKPVYFIQWKLCWQDTHQCPYITCVPSLEAHFNVERWNRVKKCIFISHQVYLGGFTLRFSE